MLRGRFDSANSPNLLFLANGDLMKGKCQAKRQGGFPACLIRAARFVLQLLCKVTQKPATAPASQQLSGVEEMSLDQAWDRTWAMS